MSIPEWEEIGIPEGYGPDRFLYNAPSETIIIELRSVGEEFSPNQIYVRKKDSPMYAPIRPFKAMESRDSAVTSLGRPLVFFLSSKFTKRDGQYGGDLLGLYCFDILNETESEIVGKDSLLLPPPYNRGWVSELVSASENASTLILKVGMMVENDAPGFHMVDYRLASLSLETKQLSLISQLKGAFF